MQTNFSITQLADPNIEEADSILRRCVHCGFCLATCPTYLELGNELDSPRGRIYLIKDMLENDKPASKEVTTHIDRCLSCLSCVTTCPSGVDYMHLVDQARVRIEKTYRRPFADRVLRGMLARVIPYRGAFPAGAPLARIGRLLVPLLKSARPRRRALRGHAAAGAGSPAGKDGYEAGRELHAGGRAAGTRGAARMAARNRCSIPGSISPPSGS